MTRRPIFALVAAGILVGAYLYLQRPDPEQPEFELSGRTMGTTYNVIVVGPGEKQLEVLGPAIQARLDELEARYSTWDDASELSELNRAPADEWVPASAELCAVLEDALAISRFSDGAFDPTIGPLVQLWGFASNSTLSSRPGPALVDDAMAKVGYRRLQVDCDNTRVRKSANVSVDLSAYAKGYAADQIGQLLLSAGITGFLVEVGGEVAVHGGRGNGEPWRVAVEAPDAASARPIGVIRPASRAGIATSGDYRNFHEIDGERYSHIVDPRTGYPVRHATAAVTVVAEFAAEADAWATALLVLGSEKGLELADRQHIAALFVERTDDGFATHASRAFERVRME